MRPLTYPALVAADISSNQFSVAIPSQLLFYASAQAVVTGSSPVGTLKLQVSNDILNTTSVTPTNWSDIGTPVSVSATGVFLIPKLDICYTWVRVAWIKGSGTGAISANLVVLGV